MRLVKIERRRTYMHFVYLCCSGNIEVVLVRSAEDAIEAFAALQSAPRELNTPCEESWARFVEAARGVDVSGVRGLVIREVARCLEEWVERWMREHLMSEKWRVVVSTVSTV